MVPTPSSSEESLDLYNATTQQQATKSRLLSARIKREQFAESLQSSEEDGIHSYLLKTDDVSNGTATLLPSLHPVPENNCINRNGVLHAKGNNDLILQETKDLMPQYSKSFNQHDPSLSSSSQQQPQPQHRYLDINGVEEAHIESTLI